MSLLAAIDRGDVANYVEAVFIVYLILIFARILLSWVENYGRIPYNIYLRRVIDFIHETTDPYLNLFRRILPPLGGRGFGLDLSPIIAIFVLLIVRAVVVGLIEG